MIKEEYCTLETCKLLKEAGFPQNGLTVCGSQAYHDDILKTMILKPTQSQAMRWMREDRHMFVEISYDPGFARPPYYVEIQTLPEGGFIDDTSYPMAHHTYEAAAEAGIQAACQYLIKGNKQ